MIGVLCALAVSAVGLLIVYRLVVVLERQHAEQVIRELYAREMSAFFAGMIAAATDFMRQLALAFAEMVEPINKAARAFEALKAEYPDDDPDDDPVVADVYIRGPQPTKQSGLGKEH